MAFPSIHATKARLANINLEEATHLSLVLDFLQNKDNTGEDKVDLLKMLNTKVERQPWIFRDPIHDMEERLELLNSIAKSLPIASPEYSTDLQASAWAHAFLSLLSTPALRSLKTDQERLLNVCASVRPFTTAINKGTGLGKEQCHNQGDEPGRDAAASYTAKERDGHCILSFKRGILHASHIVAFGATKNLWSLNMLRKHWCVAECIFADDPEFSDYMRRLVFQPPGSIDKPSNLVTMNSYMHNHWDDSYFGLKVIGMASGIGVEVQYIQLYSTKVKGTLRKFAQDDLLSPPEASEGQQRFKGFFEFNGKTRHRIQNGDVFTIHCRTFNETLQMSYLLKLRWAATQLQFLAGAAGVHLDEPDEEDWTEPEWLNVA